MWEERFASFFGFLFCFFFTDGNWEELWCCQYQAIGVRPEIDFLHRSFCTVLRDVVPNPHTCVRRWLLGLVLAGGTKTSQLLVWCHCPTFQPLTGAFNCSSSFPLTPHSSWCEQMEGLGMNYMNESWKHKERMKTEFSTEQTPLSAAPGPQGWVLPEEWDSSTPWSSLFTGLKALFSLFNVLQSPYNSQNTNQKYSLVTKWSLCSKQGFRSTRQHQRGHLMKF